MAKPFNVFIQEDDEKQRVIILDELKHFNYLITFFPKEESLFDLIDLKPDMVIPDYQKMEVIDCHQLGLA